MNILKTIVEGAMQAGIPFLMIGGNAVIAYGFPRQTVDLDLLTREEDRAAWDDFTKSLGYAVYQSTRNFLMYNPVSVVMPPLDLMLVDRPTFERMAADSTTVKAASETVRIPSLRHLIALKLHALRSGQVERRERDLLDIVTLVQLNAVDLASRDYVEILERYGTESVRREIRRRLAGFESPDA